MSSGQTTWVFMVMNGTQHPFLTGFPRKHPVYSRGQRFELDSGFHRLDVHRPLRHVLRHGPSHLRRRHGVHLEQAPLKDERLANDLRKELETILHLALRQRKGPRKGRTPGKTLEKLRPLGYLR